MSRVNKPFFFGLSVAFGLWLFLFQSNLLPVREITLTTIDTLYVDRPYKEIMIKEIEVEVPVTVTIYQTDTVYRQLIEHDTLITSVEITPKMASVHTLTPLGVPMIQHYNFEGFQTLQINHEGVLTVADMKRQKKLRNLERAGMLIGGILLGRKMN